MNKSPRFDKAYPELALFPDDEERRLVLKRSQRRLYRTWRFWGFWLGCFLVQAIVGFFIPSLRLPFISIQSHLVLMSALIGGLVAGTFGSGFQYLWRKPIQRMLREELTARGIPICLRCGYDLRGQTEPRCPECAEPFDLTHFQQKHQP